MPRESHRFQERPSRREREDGSRYRPRDFSPPSPVGIRTHREAVTDRGLWEMERAMRKRSRSPGNDRRRGRNTPERTMSDRMRFESPIRATARRSRERDVRARLNSPRKEAAAAPSRSLRETKFSPPDGKYLDDKSLVQWTDPSQDITSAALGYSGVQQHSNNHGLESTTDHPVIPEFNPESSKLNSEEWIQLVETTGNERGWKQDEKLYIMTSRLAGFARQWYLTFGVNCKSWSELKDTFMKTFPVELDYHALLSKMMGRVKEGTEPLSTYFLHKVALLNECEIQGVKAVSCIIAGLSNAKMQQQARLQKCEDPDQLYLFLRSLNPEDSPVSKSVNKTEENSSKKGKRASKKDCYFCGTPGHILNQCPLLKKHKCSVCHMVGHECQTLADKRPQLVHNQVMEGSLSHCVVQPKNFTEVFLNGMVLKAYVDFESESITIKEENAIQTRLPIKKQYKMVKGFAGSSLSSIGYIDTSMYIDRAIANVRLSVVPNNIQSVPVVVGKAFTQQPHILILKDGGKLRFYQRTDNGATNFEF